MSCLLDCLSSTKTHSTCYSANMGTETSAANLAKVQAAVTETWTLYAFGTLAIALRIWSRTRLVGLAGYDVDDYLVWFGWVSIPFRKHEREFNLHVLI